MKLTINDIPWRRVVIAIALLAASSILLSRVRVDDTKLRQSTAAKLLREAVTETRGAAAWHEGKGSLSVRLETEGDAAYHGQVKGLLEQASAITPDPASKATLAVGITEAAGKLSLSGRLTAPDGTQAKALSGEATLADWTSLLPPVVAILFAVVFRQLIVALFAAIWLGAGLHFGMNPFTSLYHAFYDYLWGNLADEFNLLIFAFTFSLVGMVSVVTRMGGTHGLVEAIAKRAKTARSTRLATAGMGLAIFFDDYANTVVVGTTMRALTDRFHISREKLAYLVDSTAAPIAGIAVVSTWIGFEVDQFQKVSDFLGLEVNGYAMFFQVLPYRFYCLFTIVFVLASVVLRRDFGPMLKAERRAAETGAVMRPGATPLTSGAFQEVKPVDGAPLRWWNAVIPVGVVLIGTFAGMLAVGASSSLFEGRSLNLLAFADWRDAFIGVGEFDNGGPAVLAGSAIVGSLVAIGLSLGQGILKPLEAAKSWLTGAQAMVLANSVLLLAWAIRSVCADVGTPFYMAAALQDVVAPLLIPLLVFLLSAVVAFSTGTSWGTMGILLPVVGPIAYGGDPIILLLSLGAVLDGAIYGDHCSPISDTTVLSSISSSCDHIDHVKTQLPYATVTMAAAGLCGYLLIAAGGSILTSYALATVVLVGVLLVVGRDPDATRTTP